jgi:hypothetical protein
LNRGIQTKKKRETDVMVQAYTDTRDSFTQTRLKNSDIAEKKPPLIKKAVT